MIVHTTSLGWQVIGCGIEVHRTLGPGLLESAYQRAMSRELKSRGLRFEQQVPVPLAYKGAECGLGFRADLIVESELLVELKVAILNLPVHERQVMTYLRVLGLRQGLLMNFSGLRLVDGLRSVLLSDPRRH